MTNPASTTRSEPLTPRVNAALGSTNATPPSPATPPGINLMSGVSTPVVGPFDEYTTLISVAADGTLWVAVVSPSENTTGYASLSTYDFGQAATQQIYNNGDAQITALSAVSVDTAYVVITDANSTWVGMCQSGVMTQLPPLPAQATPASVSAAADGTVWILDTSGIPYAMASGTPTPIATPGLALTMVSVGTADLVIAVDGNSSNVVSWNATTGWTSFQGAVATWAGGCSDGAVWLLTGTVLTAVLADGTTKSMDVSSIEYPDCWTASSRMCAYALGAVGIQAGVTPIAFGLLDLPAVPWPAMTTGQQAAYVALSNALNVTDAKGVRGQYTNSLEPFSDWYTDVKIMQVPSGIAPADWAVVQAQVSTELLYVQAVYNLFANLATLTGYIATMQSDQLQGVAADVGLTEQKQGQSEVTVLLQTFMTTLLTRVGSLFPPPYGLAVSLIGAGIAAASTYTSNEYNPGDSSQNLTVQYYQLATAMSDNLAQAITEQESEQAAVLTDWGKLSAAGQAIAQGIWSWPVGLTGASLTGIEPVLQLYFFQALMPARWQILQGEVVYTPRLPSGDPKAPGYAIMSKDVTDSQYDMLVWYYVCCGLGSSADILGNSGPYPASSLMSDIFALNVVPSDFFGGQNGWALPVVQSSGWSDPPSDLAWNGYGG